MLKDRQFHARVSQERGGSADEGDQDATREEPPPREAAVDRVFPPTQFSVATALPLAALVGRPIGVMVAVGLALTAGGFVWPLRSGWRDLLVVGFIASIGFSFALFVASGILPVGALLTQTRMGALATIPGSVLAFGAAWILRVGRFMNRQPSA